MVWAITELRNIDTESLEARIKRNYSTIQTVDQYPMDLLKAERNGNW